MSSDKGALHRLRLVQSPISQDTVQVLQELLEAARAGELTGIAFAANLKGGAYVTNAAGECYDRPTKALGMISLLADQIRTLQHAMDPGGRR